MDTTYFRNTNDNEPNHNQQKIKTNQEKTNQSNQTNQKQNKQTPTDNTTYTNHLNSNGYIVQVKFTIKNTQQEKHIAKEKIAQIFI